MNNIYHVSKKGKDTATGREQDPFFSISKAAKIVEPGDTVVVHEGVYREWVKPIHGGSSKKNCITFQAAEGEKVEIKGSEVIEKWELVEGNVWKAVINNTLFGEFNPFEQVMQGDWFMYPLEYDVHRGDVYMNGKSFYEARTLEDVFNPKMRIDPFIAPLSTNEEFLKYPEDSIYQWYAEVDETKTIIYANFQQANPNEELIEINVRESCFYPIQIGVDYITVSGFEIAQAATPWAPPTSHQIGIVGPNWSKGWVIQDNIIHDAKCSAISLGKEFSTGQNLCSRQAQKPGYQYQWESMFEGLRRGWSKEKVGSHVVRNNKIYDCGQNAIVGNMGAIFSKIYDNHIYNIGIKHEFFGFELAGIKFHTPIDTEIVGNNVHDCTIGIWLDWEIQGTRISHNLFYNNDLDCNLEVSHGPLTVDFNIFGSKFSLNNHAQGIAFIHNLFAGKTRVGKVLDRATPYHLPHSTQPLGCSLTYSGDEHYYNNLFIGTEQDMTNPKDSLGTCGYDSHPDSYEIYNKLVEQRPLELVDDFSGAEQPVFIDGNVYYLMANNYKGEKNFYNAQGYNPVLRFIEEDSETYVELTMPHEHFSVKLEKILSYTLNKTRISNMLFETSNEEEIIFEMDYLNRKIEENLVSGPFSTLEQGYNKIRVW